ncbi:hypothetical protein SDJN02_06665, partial [Cucurbita argyrosperma subsp. argyrosperma]
MRRVFSSVDKNDIGKHKRDCSFWLEKSGSSVQDFALTFSCRENLLRWIGSSMSLVYSYMAMYRVCDASDSFGF